MMFVALKLARFSCGLLYFSFPNHLVYKLTFVARMGIGIGITIQFAIFISVIYNFILPTFFFSAHFKGLASLLFSPNVFPICINKSFALHIFATRLRQIVSFCL
jgi:hypothetical protein